MRLSAVRKVVKLIPKSKTPNYKHHLGKFYVHGVPMKRTRKKLNFSLVLIKVLCISLSFPTFSSLRKGQQASGNNEGRKHK